MSTTMSSMNQEAELVTAGEGLGTNVYRWTPWIAVNFNFCQGKMYLFIYFGVCVFLTEAGK